MNQHNPWVSSVWEGYCSNTMSSYYTNYKCKVIGVSGVHGVALCLEHRYPDMNAAVAGFKDKLKKMGVKPLTKFEVTVA